MRLNYNKTAVSSLTMAGMPYGPELKPQDVLVQKAPSSVGGDCFCCLFSGCLKAPVRSSQEVIFRTIVAHLCLFWRSRDSIRGSKLSPPSLVR